MSAAFAISRPVDVGALAPGGEDRHVAATEAERQALARDFGVLSIEALEGTFHLRPWRRGVLVEGTVSARLTQRCVVSLVPVAQVIEERVSLRFVPQDEAGEPSAAELVVEAEGEDPPEAFDGRVIDLGAVLAEHMALAIDPYPRAAGAELPEHSGEAAGAPDSPFAELARLKGRTDGGRP